MSSLAYSFDVPAGAVAVRLASRTAIPADIEAGSSDTRRLGVPIERIRMSDGDLSIEAWHGHARLDDGFYADDATHRWTDGLAVLPDIWLSSFSGSRSRTAPDRERAGLPSSDSKRHRELGEKCEKPLWSP